MKGMVTILLAGLLMPVAAVAQEWKTYTYPDAGFSIQFPGVPAVQTGTIKNSTGVPLPMTRYVVRQDHLICTLSIVNYSNTNADSLSTISETERSLGASGKVTAASGARIGRNFGRALSITSTDGSRSAIALFFVDKHLYTLVGQALPPNAPEGSDDALRFRESLQFLDDNGGFGGFFSRAAKSPEVEGRVVEARPVESRVGEGRVSGANNLHADAACAGKSAGDAVQLETPGGPVPATCTLVARPNIPSDGPAGAQNPDGRQNAAPAH